MFGVERRLCVASALKSRACRPTRNANSKTSWYAFIAEKTSGVKEEPVWLGVKDGKQSSREGIIFSLINASVISPVPHALKSAMISTARGQYDFSREAQKTGIRALLCNLTGKI